MTDNPFDVTAPTPTGMTAGEVLNLVSLFDRSLERMELRLIAKMDESVGLANERWIKHDNDDERNRTQVVGRFEKVESELSGLAEMVREHHQQKHDEDVATQARVKPLKMSVTWVWGQRKDILLFIIFIMAAWAAIAETFGRILGPHAP